MMSSIPHTVLQVTIVGVVGDDLLFRHVMTRSVLELSIGELEDYFGLLAAQWCVSSLSSDRRSHVLEHHHILL